MHNRVAYIVTLNVAILNSLLLATGIVIAAVSELVTDNYVAKSVSVPRVVAIASCMHACFSHYIAI